MNGLDTAGCWRGIVSHKNTLGRLMVMSIALCSVSTGSGLRRLTLFVLSASLLLLSRSAGSILSVIVLLMCWPAVWLLRKPIKVLLTGGILLASVLGSVTVYTYAHAGEIAFALLDRLGKSTTLSGRGPLWFLCLKYISDRPWFGYGYSAFWLGADGQYSSQIWKILRWEVPHAHNGFLELCLDIGIIGLILFLCVYFAALAQSIKALRRARSQESMWTLMFLVFLFAANLSENTLLFGKQYFLDYIRQCYLLLLSFVRYRCCAIESALP